MEGEGDVWRVRVMCGRMRVMCGEGDMWRVRVMCGRVRVMCGGVT